MKGFIALAVFGVLVVVGFIYVSKSMQDEQGTTIAYEVGNPNGDTQEIHVLVAPLTTMRDKLKYDQVHDRVQTWDEWIRDHYVLLASNGDRVELIRRSSSSLISSQKARAAPEFFLVGTVKTGESYMFDFKPIVSEPERFRDKFTVSQDGVPFKRKNFKPVVE
ncbi:MAG: hypothetical protein O7D94_01690 [Planctomycetota bacterium]|nr:hypothetical protein [Planctomycetota bacterium]